MTEANVHTGTVDHIKLQKFKKPQGYDPKLNKLFTKAKKAKPGALDVKVRSSGSTLKFKSSRNKPSPVNIIDCQKIKDLKTSTPAERVVAFAYPGPNEKIPIMLHAMRFKEEKDYKSILEVMESRELQPQPSPPSPKVQQRSKSANSAKQVSPQRSVSNRPQAPHRQHETAVRNAPPPPSSPPQRSSSSSSSLSSSSSSSSSTSSSSSSRPKSKQRRNTHKRNAQKCQAQRRNGRDSHRPVHIVNTYISTDNLIPTLRRRARTGSPTFKRYSPRDISYLTTNSRRRLSRSARRPTSLGRPTRSPYRQIRIIRMPARSMSSYDSDSDSYSSSSSTYTSNSYISLRSRNRLGSRYSNTDNEPELFNNPMSRSRSYIISRRTRDQDSNVRCRPMGGVRLASETPRYRYMA